MNEKDMIERYIYEVTRRVPQENRDEIRLELQSLIEDMCAGENCSAEDALQKLGNPVEFAKRYRDDSNYLIGPEYYDNYIWVLKIALIGIAISAAISGLVSGITDTLNWGEFFGNFFAELFTTFFSGIFSVVGAVTIVFAILEWQKVKVQIKPKEQWNVSDLTKNVAFVKSWTPRSLPPIPDKRAIIKRSDSVISIIFITVFAALLLFAPQLFGAFHYDGNSLRSISCIFNLKEWGIIAPILFICLFAALVDEIIRLATGYYCRPVILSSIACNAIQIVGAVVLFKTVPFLNPNFLSEIQAVSGINKFSNADILVYWGTEGFGNVILGIICIISLVETGTAVYKTLRYAE